MCKWLLKTRNILILQFSILTCRVRFMKSIHCQHLVIVEIICTILCLIYPQRLMNIGSFHFFCFSKVSVRCISRLPNYVSKIWGQILGLNTPGFAVYTNKNYVSTTSTLRLDITCSRLAFSGHGLINPLWGLSP